MTNNPNNKEYIVSYLTMRKAVGWLGMLLPFILLAGNYCINHLRLFNNTWLVNLCCSKSYTFGNSFKSSISHYYYTTVGELFTGTLCAVALFMFCYKGHPKRKSDRGLSDSVMTNLAGIFAMGVVVFPTGEETVDLISDNLRGFVSTTQTGYIHFTCAALFFITLAFISMVNFRRSQDPSKFGKGWHDNRYLWCGIVMISCLLLIFIYVQFFQKDGSFLEEYIPPVFCLEAIALMAFGTSWLTKGQADFMYIPKKLGLKKKS